jgi:hypothetical protein
VNNNSLPASNAGQKQSKGLFSLEAMLARDFKEAERSDQHLGADSYVH